MNWPAVKFYQQVAILMFQALTKKPLFRERERLEEPLPAPINKLDALYAEWEAAVRRNSNASANGRGPLE
jgi:hypothetical protein